MDTCLFFLCQSIFMFPLSFSSSSSLSSIPCLDSISELDRNLSDISEDDDRDDVTNVSPQALTSHTTIESDVEHVDTSSSELLGGNESCQAESSAAVSCFSLRSVAKYFIVCFLSVLGKNGSGFLSSKILAELTEKLSSLMSAWRTFSLRVSKYLTSSMSTFSLGQILNTLTLLKSLFISCLPSKLISLAPAFLVLPTQEHLIPPCVCPPAVSSSLLFSTLVSFPYPNLSSSLHRHLLNPSPLLLPCLLVVFLLAVMLTASQSLALALVLATPLGVTLCYLESVVSRQQRAVLPLFAPEMPEELLGFNKHPSPARSRNTSSTWTQEMCDPAA